MRIFDMLSFKNKRLPRVLSIDEFKSAITAYTNWKGAIIASYNQSITNGFTEGGNNKIKVLKRNAYGDRNFEHFRKRILFMLAA